MRLGGDDLPRPSHVIRNSPVHLAALDRAVSQLVATGVADGSSSEESSEAVARTLAIECPDLDEIHLVLALHMSACINAAACANEGYAEPLDLDSISGWLLALTEVSIDAVRDAIPRDGRDRFLTAAFEVIDRTVGESIQDPEWRPMARDAICLPRSNELTSDDDVLAPYPLQLADKPPAVFELVLLAELATHRDLAAIGDIALLGEADHVRAIALLGSRRAIPHLAEWLVVELSDLAGPDGDPLEALQVLLRPR